MTNPFIRNLLPYFKNYPLLATWERMSLTTAELRKWKHLPLDYLSDKEKLNLAVALIQDRAMTTEQDFNKVIDILESLEARGEQQYKGTSRLLRGIIHFEQGLICAHRAQSKAHLRIGHSFVKEAAQTPELFLLAKLHEVLFLVTLNRLEEGIRLLHGLSRTPPELALTVYQTLEKVYLALGQLHWSKFYQVKRIKKRYPVHSCPQGPSQTEQTPLM